LIGFDARDREHKENHFASCFWSYFDREKSEMVFEKTRKKIAYFYFFGFGACTARAVSSRNYKLQRNFFTDVLRIECSTNAVSFIEIRKPFLYGVVEIPWIHPHTLQRTVSFQHLGTACNKRSHFTEG
jgi:hypothetical protein